MLTMAPDGVIALPKTQLSCPASLCKKPDSPQEELAPSLLASAGVTAAWAQKSQRCSYCGLVYTSDGDARTIRGYFNNPVFPEGWRPIYV